MITPTVERGIYRVLGIQYYKIITPGVDLFLYIYYYTTAP
jgi:hypothetical protein